MSPATRPPADPAPAQAEGNGFQATADKEGERLDRFLAVRLADQGLSRERLKRLILEGKASVNGRPALSPKQRLAPGDRVLLFAPPAAVGLQAEPGDLTILYRDQVLAVLNKPAGLTVHPAPGRPGGTLVQRLLAHFPELAGQEGLRPGIVHRLDKDTSGLMLVALTEECRLALAAMFARREVFKEYLALCRGLPPAPFQRIDAPLGRDPANKTRMAVVPGGRQALSEARLLRAGPLGRFSLMAVRIFTGRTHQVRVHMRHVGQPLWGDAAYGPAPRKREFFPPGCEAPARQMLHAWKLAFCHPLPHKAGKVLIGGHTDERDGQMRFLCPPPEDFIQTARCLSRRTLPVVITGMPGCGKSALLDILRDKGLPAFSADACVAALYGPGGDGRRILRQRFGARFVPDDEGRPVDKAALGAAMAADEALRREIAFLIHPLAWHAARVFVRERQQEGADLAFLEIPLYLESGRHKQPLEEDEERPLLVGVCCSRPLRLARLEEKRGWTPDVIARMDSWQWPEDKKMQACDLLLDNNGTVESLRGEAEKLLGLLRAGALEREEREMQCMRELWTAWS